MRMVLRYALPLLALCAVTALFLSRRRFRPLGRRARYLAAGAASLPLVASGTLHLLHPEAMVPLLPLWVPQRTLIILLTGLPELAGAVGLFVPRARRAAALGLSVFMIAIFPANVYVAGQRISGLQMPGVPVRTAMQAAYIVLILIAGYGWPRPGAQKAAQRAAG